MKMKKRLMSFVMILSVCITSIFGSLSAEALPILDSNEGEEEIIIYLIGNPLLTKITLSQTSYVHTFSEIEPEVTLEYKRDGKDGEYTTLIEGVDYTVSYSNNIEVGTAMVTVKGMGSYGSKAYAYFDITHDYTSTVTKQPTCTTEGVRTYTCSCGDTYTESIPATNIPTLVQNTFTLDGKIGVNCDYEIPTEYVNGDYTINAVFTGDSETVTAPIDKTNTVTVNEATAYRFTLPVASCDMTEIYSAQLVITDSEGNQVDQSETTDIYVNKYLKLYSMSSDTALKNLSSALRTYGYYSQQKFNTDATLPITTPNDVSDVTSATVKEYAQKTETYDSDTKVTLGSPTLLVESETTIRFYISDLNGISANNLYLNYTVDGVTEKSKVQYSTEKEMYYADIPNIGAGKLSDMYTAYFTNGTAQVSDTVTYGAYSYIFTTLKFSTDSTLKNLVRALYKYSVAADEYLG